MTKQFNPEKLGNGLLDRIADTIDIQALTFVG